MNLYKIYHDICNRGQERGTKRKTGFELHHILPKSMNGTNDSSNLSLLTPKEHYTVHHCLAKTGNKKMIFAFNIMLKQNDKMHRIKNSLTSKQYEIHRINLSNAMKGIKRTEEHKNILRELGKKRFGENNNMFGKKHSEETKQKMRQSAKGRIISEDQKLLLSKIKIGKKPSEETRIKMKDSQLKRWNLIKINSLIT